MSNQKSISNRFAFLVSIFLFAVLLNAIQAQDNFPVGIFGLDDPANFHLNNHEIQLIYGINTNYLFGVINDEASVMTFCIDTTGGDIQMNIEQDPTGHRYLVDNPYSDYRGPFYYYTTEAIWPYISRSYYTNIDSSEIELFVNNVNGHYGADLSGMRSILVAHQGHIDDPNHWCFIQYACSLMQRTIGSEVNSSVISNIFQWNPLRGGNIQDFFADVDSLDIYQHEQYPFHVEHQDPNNLTDSSAFNGNDFQTDIVDTRIIGGYQQTWQALRNSGNQHTKLELIMQTHRAWSYADGDSAFFRRPTEAEIWLQSFLGLSRNFKGIHAYIYMSYHGAHGSQTWGLVDESSPRAVYYPHYTRVGQLFDHSSVLGSQLLPLNVDTAFTWTGTSTDYIQNITGDSLDGSHRTMEVSIFYEYNSNDYFMLINRRCNRDSANVWVNAYPQHISLTIDPDVAGTYQIRDLYSNELYITSDNIFRDIEILA
ncbi:MAG: hypothetical protein ACFFDN_36360, partial [Candidatus Hodarchaeota archaeon]